MTWRRKKRVPAEPGRLESRKENIPVVASSVSVQDLARSTELVVERVGVGDVAALWGKADMAWLVDRDGDPS